MACFTPRSAQHSAAKTALYAAARISSHSRPLSRLSSWDVLAYFNHRWVSEDNDYSLSGAGAQIGSRHLFGTWQLRPSQTSPIPVRWRRISARPKPQR